MTNATQPDPVLGARFLEALRLAVDLHAQQARKGSGVPYLGHLLGVCGLVIDAGGSEDEAIAAVLHDAVEDQGGANTLERIHAQFGSDVAAIVEACSDTDVLPKPPWRVRKEAYLEHLLTAPPSVLRVSLADKLNNLRAIVRDYGECGEDVWARFDPDADPAWYYGSLLHIFEERLPVPMTKELRETYNRLLEMTGTPEPARQGHGSVDSAP
jgi:(p)ppGpp synthase/HD superfamily hydrolase